MRKFLAYRPEKVLWYGLVVLGVIASSLVAFMQYFQKDEIVRLSEVKRAKEPKTEAAPLVIALSDRAAEKWTCPIPDVQQDLLFSLDPPRPDMPHLSMQVSVRLKQQSLSQKFSVPCRIDLVYRDGVLAFSEGPSSFWLQLTQAADGVYRNNLKNREFGKEAPQNFDSERANIAGRQGASENQDSGVQPTPPKTDSSGCFSIQGQVFVDDQSGVCFPLRLQESPLQTAQELQEESPFRSLVEGRWWGQDLFYQNCFQGKLVHRIDVGSPLEAKFIDVDEKQWIVFRKGAWQTVDDLKQSQDSCIARIKSSNGAGLEIEGWEERRHVRFLLPLVSLSPFAVKAEELFGSIRVRSDKQISCVLDKQCLILKVHDWVLKTAGRWKILKKPEEKEAFLQGKLSGELFVLDQISTKQGQKSILGHIYHPARTQAAAIDLSVSAREKSHGKPAAKGVLR